MRKSKRPVTPPDQEDREAHREYLKQLAVQARCTHRYSYGTCELCGKIHPNGAW